MKTDASHIEGQQAFVWSDSGCMENLEPRLLLSGAWDNVSEIFLEQCALYQPDVSGPVDYVVEIGFEALTDSIGSARFRPTSEPEGWVNIVDNDEDGETEEWFYELSFTDPAEMAAYTSEAFVLEITFAGAETLSTSIQIADDQGQPLALPTDVPTFISPTHYQTAVALDASVDWQSITDPNVTGVEIEVGQLLPVDPGNPTSPWEFNELACIEGDASMTTSGALTLSPDGTYHASLLLDNARDGVTADGVATFVTSCVEGFIQFSTHTDLLSQVDSVTLAYGHELDEGVYAFSFEMDLVETNDVQYARLLGPDGGWANLNQDGDDEWYFEFINSDQQTVATTFAPGVYTLELDFGGGLFARTTFDFSDPGGASGDPVALPTQAPVFTNPLDGTLDVATDATFGWESVSDATVDMIEFELENDGGEQGASVMLAPSAVSYTPGTLAEGTNYNAELTFINGDDTLVNPDGISYGVGGYVSDSVDFTTAGQAMDPVLANIRDVSVNLGAVHQTDGSTLYMMDFVLAGANGPWFNSAEIRPSGGSWMPLSARGADPQDNFYWGASVSDTNLMNLAPYVSGQYELRFTLADASTVTTVFDGGAVSIGVTEAPQFTAPTQGQQDVDPTAAITWTAPSDAAINDIRCELAGPYGETIVMDVDAVSSSATLPADVNLVGLQSYSAMLTFMAAGVGQTNTDGVEFHVNTYQASSVDFTTEANPLMNIGEVFIEQGVAMVDGTPTYWFEAGFSSFSNTWFTSARMQSPDGAWHDLSVSSETYGEGEFQTEQWEAAFEADSTTAADLAGFGDGTYTFEVTLAAGGTLTTSFQVGGVAAPSEQPQFTAPLNGATEVAADVTFAWTAPTDPNVTEVDLVVKDAAGEEIIDMYLSPGDGQFAQAMLAGTTNYTAELSFSHSSYDINSDGVGFNVSRGLDTVINFTTAAVVSPLDHVVGVEIERGEVVDEYGTTGVFEFTLQLDATDFFDYVELSPDGGATWQSLYSIYDDGGDGLNEASFSYGMQTMGDAATLADYGDGDFTLRFTLSDQSQVQTVFSATGLDASALPAPTFTTPLDGSSDMAGDGAFQWAPIDSTAITGIELMVGAGGTSIFERELDAAATSFTPEEPLLDGMGYAAELSFFRDGATATNDDGLSFMVSSYRSSMITFVTAGTLDLAALVQEVYIDQGAERVDASASGYGQTEYEWFFEFEFTTPEDGWFSNAMLGTPSDSWYYLSQKTDDGYAADGEDTLWSLELSGDQDGFLSDFGPGTYTLQLDLMNGSQVTIDFEVAAGLDIPAEYPQILAPLAGSMGAPLSGLLEWAAVTDADVDLICASIWPMDEMGEWQDFEDLDASATSAAYQGLTGGSAYLAEVEFIDGTEAINADGIAYTVGMISTSLVRFDSYSEWSNAYNLMMRRGVETMTDGDHYVFEADFLAEDGWATAVTLTAPGGASLTLLEQADDGVGGDDATGGDGGENTDAWWIGAADTTDAQAAAAFGSGNYTLTITLAGGGQISTTVAFDDQLGDVAQSPQFTSPADGAVDVPVESQITWDAVTDPNVTAVRLTATDDYGMKHEIWLTPGQNNYTPEGGLNFAQNYRYGLEFHGESEEINADNLRVVSSTYTRSEIGFATISSNLSVNEFIRGIDIYSGVADDGEGVQRELAQVRLFSDTDTWIDTIEVSADGQAWATLEKISEGDYGYRWEMQGFSFDLTGGSLHMRFTQPGGAVETTQFDYTLGAAPAVPQLAGALAGSVEGIDPEALIAWAAAGEGVEITSLELVDLSDGERMTWMVDDSRTELDVELMPLSTYGLDLRHYGEGEGVMNSDGVMCRVGRFSALRGEFTTGLYANLGKMIDEVNIVKGRVTLPDGAVKHWVEVMLSSKTAEWYTGAWVKAAKGAAFDEAHALTPGASGEGDYEGFVSMLELLGDDATAVAEFDNGTWWLKIQTDSAVYETTLDVDGLEADAIDAPVITTPAAGAAAVLPFTPITWAPVTHPSVVSLVVRVVDGEGNIVIDEDLPADATEFLPVGLELGTSYTLQVAAITDDVESEHADGFTYCGSSVSVAQLDFTTAVSANVWDLVEGVEFEVGDSIFEMILTTPVAGWFTTAEIQDLEGAWHPLHFNDDADAADGLKAGEGGVEYSFDIEGAGFDPQAFGAGSYALRFTLAGGQQYTTTIEFDPELAAPTETPVFTAPQDGAQGVAMLTEFAWQAPTDGNIAEVWLMIEDAQGNEILDEILTPDVATWAVELLGASDYTATLIFVTASQSVSSEGFAVSSARTASAELSFRTESPMVDIHEIFIDQGVEYDNGQSPVYVIELGFDAEQDAVSSARFRLDQEGSGWITLTPEAGEEPGSDTWSYSVSGGSAAALALWSDAAWVFEFTFANQQVFSTALAQADDQAGGDALVQPTQIPNFVNLEDGFVVRAGEIIPQWSPVIDADVTSMEFGLEWGQDEAGADTDNLDATDLGAFELVEDTVYYASLLLDNARTGQTDEGVNFFVTKYVENSVEFNTYASLFDALESVEIHRSQEIAPDATTTDDYEFVAVTGQTSLFDAATLIDPAGQRWALSVDHDAYVTALHRQFTGELAYGDYVLELLSGGIVARTRFTLDAANAALPADAPVLTTPANGATNVRPNVELGWTAISDPATEAAFVSIEGADGSRLFSQQVAVDATSLAQEALAFNTSYVASMGALNSYSDANDLGMGFNVSTVRSTQSSFTTATALRPVDVVAEVYIQRGVTEDIPENVTAFEFTFGMLTQQPEQILGASLTTPTGAVYTLTPVQDGGVADLYAWELAVESTEALSAGFGAGEMSDFIPGVYTLTIEANELETLDSEFLLGASVVAPTTPVFTSPVSGTEQVDPSLRFSWQSVADAAALALRVTDNASDEMLINVQLDPAVTRYSQSALAGGASYTAELFAANGYANLANADGVRFSVSMFSAAQVGFETAAPYTALSEISEVSFSRGVINEAGAAKMAFSFGMALSDGHTASARLQSPDGVWHALDNSDGHWSFLLESASAADLAGFTGGFYTLELTSDIGQKASTVFTVASLQAPLPPTFPADLQGSQDVDADAPLTWTPSASASVDFQSLIIRDGQGEVLDGNTFAADVASLDAELSYDTAYTIELFAVAQAEPVVNGLGIAFTASSFAARRVSFTTAAEYNPLESIQAVDVHMGMIAGPLSDWFVVDLALDLTDDADFENLEYAIDGQWYPAVAADAVVLATTDTQLRQTLLDAGELPLRITYGGGRQVVTVIPLAGEAALPASAVTLTAPAGEPVNPDADIAWTSNGAMPHMVMITEGAFSETPTDFIFEADLSAAATSVTPENLEYLADYTVYAGQGVDLTDTSADGLSVTTRVFNLVASEFSTVEATVDLVPTLGDVTGLDDLKLWGDQGQAQVTLTNAGTSTAAGTATVSVYLSTDDAYDGGDRFIGATSTNIDLASGESTAINVGLVIPEGLDDNDYRLIVKVTTSSAIVEDSTTNNEVLGGMVAVAAPTSNLTGSIVSLQFTSEGRIIAGAEGSVTLNLVNDGTIPMAGTCVVDIYATTGAAVDDAAWKIGTRKTTLTLAPDGEMQLSVPVELSSKMPTGYYTFFAVLDSGEAIAESDETDNTLAWDAPVSIEAQVVDFTGEIDGHTLGEGALAGDVGYVDMTLANLGNWAIRRKVVFMVYASATGEIDAQAVQIGKASVTLDLDADGGTQDASVKVKLPTTLPDGEYYLVVDIDATDAVEEANELNNLLVSAAPLNVVQPYVDLSGEFADAGYLDTAVAGERAVVILNVANNGNVLAKASRVQMRLYASTTLDAADGVEIATLSTSVKIKPGDSKDYKFKAELPADMTDGFYYLIAVIDAEVDATDEIIGQLDESSEMNNVVIADAQLQVEAQRVDLTGTLGESTLHEMPMPGMTGKVEVVLTNEGNVPNNKEYVTVSVYGVDGLGGQMLLGTELIKKLYLRPGDTRTATVDLTVPADAETGGYDLLVVVDSENAVVESDETNNEILDANAFEVVAPFVDLAPTISEVDLPEAVLPGDRGTITVTLLNQGNIPATGVVELTIYASDSATPGVGTEVEIAASTLKVKLGAGADKDYSARVVMPTEIENFDDLHFIARITPSAEVTDADAANDVAVQAGPILTEAVRDLQGELVKLDLPELVIAGDRAMAYFKVLNEGNIPAVGDIEIGLYALATGDPGAEPIAIGDPILDSIDLPAGRELKYKHRFEIPTDLDAGVDYQFYIQIDVADAVAEADETNNILDLGEPVTNVKRFGSFEGHRNESLFVVDGQGREAEFSLSGEGYGEVTLDEVTGLFVVTLTGTSSRTKVGFEPVEAGQDIELLTLSADGDVGTILADEVDLADGGSITIDGGLGRLTLRDVADQHQLTIGGDGSMSATLEFRDVTDLSIDSASPIKSLEVASWTDTDGDDLIAAPWIGSLSSEGDFMANLDLDGTDAPREQALGRVQIDGSVNDGDDQDVDWQIAGDIGSVDLAGFVDNFAFTGGDLRSLTLEQAAAVELELTGELGSLRAVNLSGGAIEAAEISKIQVDESFGASLAVAGDLGKVQVGTLDYDDSAVVDWAVDGSIGGVYADSATNLRIAAADLRSFMVDAVADSSLGAADQSIGEVKVVKVDSWTGGEIVADSVTSLVVGGDFSADMSVGAGGNQAFKSVRIGGDITGGGWTIDGDMGALNVSGSLSNWTLDLGDAYLKSFRLGDATNTSISAGEIGTIAADSWTGGTITAESVKGVKIGGDADLDMDIAGDVRSFVSDMLSESTWTLGGELGKLTVDGIDGLDLEANAVGTVVVKGDVNELTLDALQPLEAKAYALKKFVATGAVTDSSIRTLGNIAAISVGKLADSVIFAGVAADYATDVNTDGVLDLPTARSNFLSPDADLLAEIRSIAIKGGRDIDGDVMTNASVAAGAIGKATVYDVTTDNGGADFGFSAVESLKVSWRQGSSKYTFGKTWPADSGDFTVTLAEDAPGAPWFVRG